MTKRRSCSFATVIAGADGMYEITIKVIGPRPEEEVGLAAQERGPSAKAPNLARKTCLYFTAATLSDLLHKRLGHHGTTIFQRMLPLLAGHSLTAADANKVAPRETCIQSKMIKRPS